MTVTTVRLANFDALDWEQRAALRYLLAVAMRIPMGRETSVSVDALPVEV